MIAVQGSAESHRHEEPATSAPDASSHRESLSGQNLATEPLSGQNLATEPAEISSSAIHSTHLSNGAGTPREEHEERHSRKAPSDGPPRPQQGPNGSRKVCGCHISTACLCEMLDQ